MMTRVTVELPKAEFSALLDLGLAEVRTPPEQLRATLRQELLRRGMLNPRAVETGAEVKVRPGDSGK
jgi:hypothetical protein